MSLDDAADGLGPWRKAHLPGAEAPKASWRPFAFKLSIFVVFALIMGAALKPMAAAAEPAEVTAVKAAAKNYVDELGKACARAS